MTDEIPNITSLAAIDAHAISVKRKLLGDRFLAYVLGIDDEADIAVILAAPTGQQRIIVALLSSMLDNDLLEQHPFSRQIDLANRFGIVIPEQGETTANLLRQGSGAPLPTLPSTQDLVVQQILTLLQALYPLLLLPDDDSRPFGPSMAGAAHNHPGRKELEDTILKDSTFKKLFPNHDASSGWSGSILRSTGSGGGVQLWGFAEQQIRAAWQSVKLEKANPDFMDVALGVIAQVELLRRALTGKKAVVPVRVGLAVVLLPPDVKELDLGWARIKQASAQDRVVAAGTGIGGKLQTTDAEGQTVTIDYAGDLVVELTIPYIISFTELDLQSGWPAELARHLEDIHAKLESVRLGLVLGLDSADPVNVATSWQVIVDPLAAALSPSWSDTRRLPNLVPRQLTKEEADTWVVWSKRVQEHRTPSVAVSIRRMLQAIGVRNSPEDVLVDAIIVWENLFGAAQETNLRISTSLAWLLGSDAADRAKRQKDYKVLYAARSGIVHGSSSVKLDKVPAQSREAVLISISALRAVFDIRADLLKLKTSEERSIAAMLNGKP